MGDAARNLDELLAEAAGASERAMVARDDAHGQAVATIRQLERKLRDAIAGDTLRGLAKLTGELVSGAVRGPPSRDIRGSLQGARLHGGIDAPLHEGQTDVAVLSREGELVMASRYKAVWSTRPMRDDELQAQDLDLLVKVLQTVLTRHIARASRTAESYDRVARLSARLAAVVGWA